LACFTGAPAIIEMVIIINAKKGRFIILFSIRIFSSLMFIKTP
jgi:hypothetical protein